jgi:hypothetical protein
VGRPAPDFSNQVHDFNLALDNGLFWTVPVDRDSVKVEPGSGRASLVVNNLAMEDYFNIVNALNDGTSNRATASFEIHWAPGMKRFKVRDDATGMAGEFVKNSATMAWSVDRRISRDLRKRRRAFPHKSGTNATASSSLNNPITRPPTSAPICRRGPWWAST